eukprot:772453-Pleurochrysis_carterae.AAC.2
MRRGGTTASALGGWSAVASEARMATLRLAASATGRSGANVNRRSVKSAGCLNEVVEELKKIEERLVGRQPQDSRCAIEELMSGSSSAVNARRDG